MQLHPGQVLLRYFWQDTHCVQQQATTCRHALTSCFSCCGCTESLVPYAEWYFCHVAPHNVLLRTMYLVGDQHSGSGCSPAAACPRNIWGLGGGVWLTGCVQRQQQWQQAQQLPARSWPTAPTSKQPPWPHHVRVSPTLRRLPSAACCPWPSACWATQQSSTSHPSWHTCHRRSPRCAPDSQEVRTGQPLPACAARPLAPAGQLECMAHSNPAAAVGLA